MKIISAFLIPVCVVLFVSCKVNSDKKLVQSFIEAVQGDKSLTEVRDKFICEDLENDQNRAFVMQQLTHLRNFLDSTDAKGLEVFRYGELEAAERNVFATSEENNIYVVKRNKDIILHILFRYNRVVSFKTLKQGGYYIFVI